ncbi:MAG: TRAP transporter small permease subunit [Dehalococcoidia bacterium]
MKTFEKVLKSATEGMAVIGQAAIVACMVLVVSSVIKRSLVVSEIPGTFEVVELIAAVVLSMGIPYLTFVKGHVAVGVIVERFRPRTQAVFDIFNSLISLGFAGWLTHALFQYSIQRLGDGAITGWLEIPLYPFCFLVSVSLALTCVVLIRDLVSAALRVRTGGER